MSSRTTASAAVDEQLPPATAQVLAVAGRSVRRRARTGLAWAIGAGVLLALQLSAYPAVRASGDQLAQLLERYSPSLRRAFGLDDYATAAGFLHAESFSLLVPLVLVAVCVTAGAAATAADEETGAADVLATTPVSRTVLVLGHALAVVVGAAVVAAVVLVVLVAGTRAVDLQVTTGHLLAAVVATTLLGVLHGALALAVGAGTGRRGLALGVSLAVALAGYLLEVLAAAADWAQALQALSPFHWALGARPVTTGWDAGGLVLLAVVTAALVVLACLVHERHDVRVP